MFKNQRSLPRGGITHPIQLTLPVQLSFGSQITLSAQIKDLSLKSAFVIVKSSIQMAIHDELDFSVENLPFNLKGSISGTARISRVAPGEGIAVFFTKMDTQSTDLLHRIVGQIIK
jgi:hypothetical protein